MAQINKILELAASKKASDVHFSAGEPIRMRVDGDLVVVADTPSEPDKLRELLFEILTEAEKQKALKHQNLDKSYAVEGIGFFRVNIFWTRRGVAAVLRTIPQKIPTLEKLKLPPAAKKLSEAAKGLVLVTGPTGSGKSTTLAAMINYINESFPYHILTAEDPVEFVHEPKCSLINQREIGSSCPSFAEALKYALREDPDVILVGEMRDLETIGLALTAAETGHLVFGTLHTRGAGASVDRIIDSFPANQQAMIRTMLSESLIGVISQALLKRADGKGRVAAFEIMVVNHAISNLIREGKTFQMASILQTGKKDGMILMDQHILELVEQGIVTAAEAEGYMENPAPLKGVIAKRPAPTNVAEPEPQAAPPPVSRPAPPQLKVVPPPAAPPMPAPAAAAPAAPPPAPKAPPANPPPAAAVPKPAAQATKPSPPPAPIAPPKPTMHPGATSQQPTQLDEDAVSLSDFTPEEGQQDFMASTGDESVVTEMPSMDSVPPADDYATEAPAAHEPDEYTQPNTQLKIRMAKPPPPAPAPVEEAPQEMAPMEESPEPVVEAPVAQAPAEEEFDTQVRQREETFVGYDLEPKTQTSIVAPAQMQPPAPAAPPKAAPPPAPKAPPAVKAAPPPPIAAKPAPPAPRPAAPAPAAPVAPPVAPVTAAPPPPPAPPGLKKGLPPPPPPPMKKKAG